MASHSVSGRSVGSSGRNGAEGTPETEPDSSEFDLFAEWDNLGLPPVNGDTSDWDHVWENGRRYHMYEKGRYPLPNDEQEQNRDDLKHEIMLELTVRFPFFFLSLFLLILAPNSLPHSLAQLAHSP